MSQLTQLDNFYLQQPEPVRGCLMALRQIILQQDPSVTAEWKYAAPFFCYKGKMFCYLWVHKKYKQPYIGFVEGHRFIHSDLLAEKRSRIKIMLFDAEQDLPFETINSLLTQAIDLYKTGVVKIR